ncbi:carboxypeptidase-like regulatory domain-containing protein [Pedobacter aquatilis]|uniref:carboxypeptidase-like regulatory domain-containing protein n=1 Tax=Pedobacter aquatilis TaxID=351343 RepID=UPI002930D88A|nr:carboxypeptidase-like regulatory domain-containing protein [Pedobacter aquatilis]
MRTYLLLFLFTSAFLLKAKAQELISGKITDAKGGPLSYVNIGVKGGKIGTISDVKGNFKLSIPQDLLAESFTFSCIGFQEQTFSGTELAKQPNLQITLSEKIELLNEVKISNTKRKVRKLGITGRTPMVSIPTSSKTSTDIFEQARLIHLQSAAKILDASIFLISNDQREVTIRVNFYAFKNGMPAERLIEKSIIKRKILKKGWLSIDLSDEDIYIAQDFVVSFEYLPDGKEDNKRIVFAAKLGASDSWLRSNSLGLWRKNEVGGATMYVTAEM